MINLKTKEINTLLKKWTKEILYLTVGCIIMAIGTSLFLLPNQLSSG